MYERYLSLASLSALRRGRTVTFRYEGTGSSEGRYRLATQRCMFAVSDTALSREQRKQMPSAWFVPTLAGAVVVGFHLPHIASLELRIPREALADIFLGRIRLWSELTSLNPKLAGVQQNITLVVRSDVSGTSLTFSSALSSFSAEWATKLGASSRPMWPRFALAGETDNDVALLIKRHEYSLGFLSQSDSATFHVPVALISNDAGAYVAPTIESVQSAMDAFAPDLEVLGKATGGAKMLLQSIVNPKNKSDAYPISMFTYVAFDAASLTCGQLRDVLYLVIWAWTDPQAAAVANSSNLSPLAESLRRSLITLLATIQCRGESPVESILEEVGPSCAAGQWLNLSDVLQPRCESCPPGYVAADHGAHSAGAMCTACEPGLFQPAGSNECTSCAKLGDFYQDVSAQTHCEKCPSFTRRDRPESKALRASCRCETNFYLGANKSCLSCPAGGVCRGLDLQVGQCRAPMGCRYSSTPTLIQCSGALDA